MPQKNLLQQLLNYVIRLSAITSAVIITFSFGLAIAINNINQSPSAKTVLGSAETLDLDNTLPNTPDNPDLPLTENPQNPADPNNPQDPIENSRDSTPSDPRNNTT